MRSPGSVIHAELGNAQAGNPAVSHQQIGFLFRRHLTKDFPIERFPVGKSL